jgi:UDP-glucose 4-epimerase
MKNGAYACQERGYIGSHVILAAARCEQVAVLDDLSRGFRRAVLAAPW